MKLPIVDASRLIFKNLTLDGDGSTFNANVDGSVTPQLFWYSPPQNTKARIYRMIIFVRDTGVFTADGFGALAALTNGIDIYVARNNAASGATILNLDADNKVQSNADWGRLCYDARLDAYGSGDNFIVVRWTFANTGAYLTLGENDYIIAEINDDLTGLVEHTYTVQGFLD